MTFIISINIDITIKANAIHIQDRSGQGLQKTEQILRYSELLSPMLRCLRIETKDRDSMYFVHSTFPEPITYLTHGK